MDKAKYTFLIVFLIPILAVSQNWMWNKQMNSTGLNRPVSTVYKDGNIYYAGEFLESFDFDGINVNSYGLRDVYLTRMSNDAEAEWLTVIGGIGTDWVTELKISSNNNLFITGSISDAADFTGISVPHSDSYDAYLAKFDINGNVSWAKNLIWGTNIQMTLGMSVDANENIILTGYFIDEAYFGNITNPGACEYVSNPGINIFVAKFNISGNLLWKKVFTTSDDARMKAVETVGNDIYVGGYFRGDLINGIDTLRSYTEGYDDLFVMKMDQTGNILWTRIIGGNDHDRINKINADESGNIYVNGYYRSTDLKLAQNGSDTVYATETLQGNYDFLIAKYTSNGDLSWYDVNGGTGNDNYINSDIRNGELLLTGVFSNQVIYNNDTLVAGSTGTNSFFAVYDLQGTPIKARYLSGNGTDRGAACHIDEEGNYFLGSFVKSSTVIAGNQVFENVLPTVGNTFISKFGCFEEVTMTSTPVSCVDGMGIPWSMDGTATITPVGGTAPFTYNWSNGSTSQTATNLDAVNYSATVTDSDGCVVSGNVIVGSVPAVSAQIISVDNVSCNGLADGYAIAGGLNGKAPYTFSWSNGTSGTTLGPVGAGTFYVTVSDQCGNIATKNAVITQPSAITVAVSSYCTEKFQCTGGAAAIPNGGTPPYTYLWSSGETTPTISEVCKNNYWITVTDVNGCTNSGGEKAQVKWCPVTSALAPVLLVYPNPGNDVINIENDDFLFGEVDVKVYDILGKEVYNSLIQMDYENKFQINTSELPPGIYHGVAVVDDQRSTFKFNIER